MVTERRESHTSINNDDSPSSQQQQSHALSSPPQASETPVANAAVVHSTTIDIPADAATVENNINHEPYARLEALRNRLRQTFSYVINEEHASSATNDPEGTPHHENESLNQMAWRYAFCPPLYFSVCAMIIICVFLTLIKEMAFHTGLLISLGVSLLHYQDAAKFARIVSGDGGFSIFSIYAGVFLRNFVNLFVAGRTEIPQIAICYHIPGGENSFFITIARVILAEIFVMDIILVIKLLIHSLPKMSSGLKRRAFVWLEYTSYTYRMLIPFPQWFAYFSPPFLFTIYALFKAYFFVTRIIVWFKFGSTVLSNLAVGEDVPSEELDPEVNCTICQSQFKHPRKLTCSHVFCRECIRTWLDTGKDDTCPLCRSHILPPNVRKFKDYDTSFPLNFF
uniref:RING-type domain-containing protein n=1 Tax=Panagrolaimus sp. ES5 TaxID=591445 RepID=A0AC34GVY4_9BILA